MSTLTTSTAGLRDRVHSRSAHDAAYQGFTVLRVAFAGLPILAGIDKFTHLLVNWAQYLEPAIPNSIHLDANTFMQIVGVIEIVAGLIVAFSPYIGGYLVTLWLWAIIANLLWIHAYYDIALRDLGLSLGAVALARLSVDFGYLPPWLRHHSDEPRRT